MDGRVERGMRRQLAAAPADRIGWKIALNAPPIMERLGLAEPGLGWLARSRVAEGEHSLAGASNPAVEPELLIEAGADGAVAGVGVALELVDFDRPLDDLEEVIAANVFHRAVALGSIADAAAPGDAVFAVNGEERGRPAVAEEPHETLAFVRDFLGRLGERLAPGDLVIAGALAPAAPVSPGDVVEFRVEPLGAVTLRLTD